MTAINPYSLNPNQMANQMTNGLTSTQSVMPVSNEPNPSQTIGSYSTLQNQQALQNQQVYGGQAGQPGTSVGPQNPSGMPGIIANQMRSRSSAVAPSNMTAQNQEQSGLQLQPQKGLQSAQASMNASPKMTVY